MDARHIFTADQNVDMYLLVDIKGHGTDALSCDTAY